MSLIPQADQLEANSHELIIQNERSIEKKGERLLLTSLCAIRYPSKAGHQPSSARGLNGRIEPC